MQIQLSEKYLLTSDKLNLILQEKYEKREGKGKDAPLSGEFDYRNIGYFQTLGSLAEWMIKNEIFTSDEITELEEIAEKVEHLLNEVKDTLLSNIKIE